MGRSTIHPALVELSNPSTPQAQVAALQSLKNEIVGHEQRKELAVTHGVIRPLAALMRSEARKGGKRRSGQSNGHGPGLFSDNRQVSGASAQWTTEDELRFQATLVVGSLANGGPGFVAPILAGNVLPPLLEAVRPSETPAKLVTATLRVLNQIADAVTQERPWTGVADSPARPTLASAVNDQLYTKSVVESLAEILQKPAANFQEIEQTTLVVQLIIKTCQEDSHKKMLIDAGILDMLAEKLAELANSDGDSQSAEARSRMDFGRSPTTSLPDLIEAIAAIIKDSHFYTARFLYSQPMQQKFGLPKERVATYQGYDSSTTSAWERLIPKIQTVTSKSDSYTKSWPALGSYATSSADNFRLPGQESSFQQGSSRSAVSDETETPLFIWLMYIARRGQGRERLSACWLLALLKKFADRWPLNDPARSVRERHFSYLIIPLLVKMIEEYSPLSERAKRAYASAPAIRDEARFMLERAPLVLAELVTSNKALQSAAVDARILPTLVQILKKSFDTVTSSSKPLWQPRSSAREIDSATMDPASSKLGRPGLSADVLHAFKYRESILLALAALAGDQDGLRKLVIEMGAATHIIEAMLPYTEDKDSNATSATAKDGNPEAVLIAACKVTRSLSRSVSVLRTSLIDHGVAQPVYELLAHPSVNVQIAATEVITNLVLEMSPMRPEIMEAGVLKALCEQCRSANFNLRFGSLWALKHLCLGLPQPMKIQCLEELGVGWLVQVLNGEPSKPAMGTPNAAGEQVDILNAVDEPHMDLDEEASDEEDEDDDDDEDDDTMADSMPTMRRHGWRYNVQLKGGSLNVRDRLQQIKNDEQCARLNGERDEMRIQEQALDFIRNFIMENQNTGEMIDHLLKAFGHSRFFDLMDAKIRPKNSASSASTSQTQPATPTYWPNATQRSSFTMPTSPMGLQHSQQPNWATYPAPEIIHAAMFVLVHLANGRPAHKYQLISQTGLMQHVLPLLTHPRRDVRIACAWMLHNLIWLEDSSDEAAARERANLLRNLGFEEGARVLGRDIDLDIKERAKTIIDSFSRLLGEGHAQGRGSSVYGSQGFGGSGGGDSSMSALGGMGISGSGSTAGGRLGGLHGWRHDSRG